MRSHHKKILTLLLMAGCSAAASAEISHSPDGRVAIAVNREGDGSLTYQVDFDGAPVIARSRLGLTFATDRPDKPDLGRLMSGLEIVSVDRRTGQDRYQPVHGKTSRVDDPYSEIVFHAREAAGARRSLDVIVRAYDSGAAVRLLVPPQPGLDRIRILSEDTQFAFPSDYRCLGLNVGRYQNSHEGEFDPIDASHIRPHDLYDLPLVCQTGRAGTTFALSESDLDGYSGAYLSGLSDGATGVGIHLTPQPDDVTVAVDTAMPIGGLTTPWRIVMIADRPEKLAESNLVDDLAAPSRLAETGWIRPGKAAWDWWSGPLVPAGEAKATTYRRFIDFAGRFQLPYMLIDEGWAKGAGGAGYVRPDSDITQTAPGVDLPALVDYGRARHVGLWLWVNWKALDAQMDAALSLYERIGIKGIKVDFMDRQDQAMVSFYHHLLEAAARHHLMVDLHGAYVPRGLERTYPNLMTQEGVMGAEYNKWSKRETAEHNVSLAFTRGLLGPMDYTPGGFRNVTPATFTARDVAPEVMTTRAQQLAMYVVYLSPLSVLADAPGVYEESDGKPVPGADFLKMVPATWDETRALAGEIGGYVVIARRKGGIWYVGAMNTAKARMVTLPTTFLGGGAWQVDRWADSDQPQHVVTTRTVERSGDPIRLSLAPNGGAALVFRPLQKH